MDFQLLKERSLTLREKYKKLEKKKYGKEWTTAQIAQGFVGDVGDLMKLVTAKEGVRDISNIDEKLSHELADCLWSIIILADSYHIDLEKALLEMTESVELSIEKKNTKKALCS